MFGYNKRLNKLRLINFIGLILSTYGFYVEVKAEHDENYKALCDISEEISCTAVFSTIYGKGFGILQYFVNNNLQGFIPPNGLLGIIFFGVLMLTSFLRFKYLTEIWIGCYIISILISYYLAYLLYFIIKKFCLVCIAIYVVNHLGFFETCRLKEIFKRQKDAEDKFDSTKMWTRRKSQ